MGWLRETREQMGFRSDRKLAEHLLQQDGRPADLTLANLANNLGKLDRGEAGWWLSAGEPWTPLLADALNVALDDLRARIYRMAHPQVEDGSSPDRFVPFGWLDALDLATEPLPPGIPWPRDASRDGDHARVWWTSGPGAGKTLLGRWLQVRQGWTWMPARTWREALAKIPRSGRVFVELEQPGEGPMLASELPDGVEVWVAAPFAPAPVASSKSSDGEQHEVDSGEMPADATTWTELRTPPLRDWMGPLLAWVGPRVRRGGRYDPDEVMALLRTLPLVEMFETPGDVLDFLGLVDEVGAATLIEGEGLESEALFKTWLRQAIDRPDRPLAASNKALLRHDGARLLVELVQERLRGGLPPVLSLEDWTSLVPRRRAPHIDRDALMALIDRGTPEAKAEAKAMLKPSREDVIEALKGVQLLVRGSTGRWCLRPSWLANLAQNAAAKALCEEGPEGLGALLLYPQSASDGLTVLLEQASSGDLTLARACIADLDGASPERLAALDGVFRVLGHRALLGDVLPVELLSQAWDAQMEHVADRYLNFPPLPVIQIARAERVALTDQGAWLRAALAMSLHLHKASVVLPVGPLNPWGGIPTEEPAREAWRQALDRALSDTYADRREDAHGGELARACARLGVALYDHLGPQPDVHMMMHAVAPTVLVRLARDGTKEIPGGPIWEAMSLPRGLGPIEQACEAEGVPINVVIEWLWTFWSSPEGTGPRGWPPCTWVSRDLDDQVLRAQAETLWRLMPEDAVNERTIREISFRPIIWPWLQASVWSRWVRLQLESQHARVWGDKLWDHVPLPLLVETLRTAPLSAHMLPAFGAGWRRAPDELLAMLDKLAPEPERPLTGGTNLVLELMHTGLSHRSEALLDRAERWWRAPQAHPGVGPRLELWLMRAVEARVTGWRRAFELLIKDRPASPGD